MAKAKRKSKVARKAARPTRPKAADDLTAAIAVAPDDLALQSIYADALLERGGEQAARGELMQLALGGVEAEARTAELLDSFEKSLAGRGITGLQFAGGFARSWSCSSDDFASFAPEVFADEPLLREVTLELAHKDALLQCKTVAATPQLSQVRRLTIKGHKIKTGRPQAKGLEVLFGSPYWPRLERLALPWCGLGNDGAKLLARTGSLVDLQELDVADNAIGSAGIAALAKSPHLARVRWLRIDGNKPGDSGIKALAAATHLTRLEYLSCKMTWEPRESYAPIQKRFPELELVHNTP